jgi:hypothetical protein
MPFANFQLRMSLCLFGAIMSGAALVVRKKWVAVFLVMFSGGF